MSGRGKGKTAGKKSVSRSAKAGLQFPVGRIARQAAVNPHTRPPFEGCIALSSHLGL